MRWYLALPLALAALLVACSGGGGASDEEQIRDTVEAFFRAMGADLDVAYSFLSEECQQQVTFDEFAEGAETLSLFFSVSEIEVRNVVLVEERDNQVVVDLDVVLVTDGEEISVGESSLGRATLTKQDGEWRLADCENFEPDPTEESPSAEAVRVEGDPAPDLPGEFVDIQTIYGGFYGDGENTTGPHVARFVDYVADGNINPPAGGPHWSSSACATRPLESPTFCGPAQWGIYREAWEAETLVHNMEHGGVVLWYNTADQTIIDELEDLFEARLNRGDLLVMAPYFEMEEEAIALTSWARIDKFSTDEYSLERVEAFIDAHGRRFNPEQF